MARRPASNLGTLALTALAPALWGTTYVATTELMPPDSPLLVALVRTLPTGLLMLLIVRKLPRGDWWWKAGVLGALNVGVFYAFLLVSTYRLPGGIAATMGAMQPLAVLALSTAALGIRPVRMQVIAGLAGVVGVALLVLRADAPLDGWGLAAAVGSVLSMAVGLVLTKRWGSASVGPFTSTAWQLVAGGIILLPMALLVEGAPPSPTFEHIVGFIHIGLISTGFGYFVWFWGLERLGAAQTSFLSLLIPLVATAIGWIVLDETLTPLQLLGGAIAIGSVGVGQWVSARAKPQVASSVASAPEAAAQPSQCT